MTEDAEMILIGYVSLELRKLLMRFILLEMFFNDDTFEESCQEAIFNIT
jgi:hypothetical protein